MRAPIKTTEELFHYRQQVEIIAELAMKYCDDLKIFRFWEFDNFYYSVCRLPYIEDTTEEINSRPRYILKMPGADCKKKSTLIAAFCHLKKIPVRFVVMSNRPDKMPHHIYTEIKKNGKWIAADATYNGNKLGRREPETYRKVFHYEN